MIWTFALPAWEIDAAIVWHLTHLAHRTACRLFVARPCAFTGRLLNAARRSVALVARLTAVPVFYPLHSIPLNR